MAFYRKIIAKNWFWWILLVGGLLMLLIYGFSSFTAKPTVETITTHAPTPENTNQMRDVKFQQSPKSKRR